MSNRTTDRDSAAKNPVQDVLGLTLFALFSFGVLSVFFVVLGRNSDWWITQQIQVLINALGPMPSMLLCAGMAGLGVILFLRTEEVAIPKHVLGVVLVALGASLLIGGLQSGKGGAIGALLPDTIGATVGAILGVVLGLGVCAGTAYALWGGAVGKAAKPLEPSALVPPRASEPDGVSNAEAMALQAPVGSRLPSEVASPPVDVRIGGGVPVGAIPLAGGDDASVAEEDEATTQDEFGFRFDRSEERKAELEAQAADPFATPSPFETAASFPEEEAAETAVAEPTEALETDVPSPSWETETEALEEDALAPEDSAPGFFESEDVEAEPVEASWEAAGTTEVDEELEAGAEDEAFEEAAELEEEDEEELEDGEEEELEEAAELAEDEEEDEEELEEDEDEELEEAAELDEDEEEDEEALEEDEEEELEEAAELDEDEEEDEEELEEDEDEELEEAAELDEDEEEDEEELEEDEDEELEEAAELDEEEGDDEEEELVYEDGEEEAEAAELEDEEVEEPVAAELEEAAEAGEDLVYEEESPAAEDPAVPPAAGAGAPPAAWEQVGLFDEVAEAEPQVELAPTPPPATDATAAAASASGESSMLYEAGLLILEENRVAVSMLQRRFQIDFDQACVLLDKLQDLGLIGPYMGGRNREILLGLEDWQGLEQEVLAAT